MPETVGWALGGNEMRNLAKMCAVGAICLVVSVGAWASHRPRPSPPGADPTPPIAGVLVPKKPLYFGLVGGPGARRLKARTVVRVVANRPYRLEVSFRGLTHEAGPVAIPAAELKVTINGQEVLVGTEFVPAASGGPTPIHGVEVPIVVEIEVKGFVLPPAGRYGGNLVLSVM